MISQRAKNHEGFKVGDVIRMRNWDTVGGYRLWKVTGEHLGATHQESTYSLRPLDATENEPIHVPRLMLETHPGIDRM